MTADPERLGIAVALVISDSRRLLLSWNEPWQGSVLPMSKLHAGPPAESPEQAAVRAAAQALHLPVRVLPGHRSQTTLAATIARDGEIKDYVFTIVLIEAHPDFRDSLPDSHRVIWMPVEKLIAGEYQPLTTSVKPILDECRVWGWL